MSVALSAVPRVSVLWSSSSVVCHVIGEASRTAPRRFSIPLVRREQPKFVICTFKASAPPALRSGPQQLSLHPALQRCKYVSRQQSAPSSLLSMLSKCRCDRPSSQYPQVLLPAGRLRGFPSKSTTQTDPEGLWERSGSISRADLWLSFFLAASAASRRLLASS